MRLYLSGKMSGISDFNFPLFNETAKQWRAVGHDIINPAENFNGRQGLPFELYIRHDILDILDCQGLIVLPGWQASRGASLEVAIARALALPVYDATRPAWGEEEMHHYSETIAEEASRLVLGERNRSYGSAEEDFARIGAVWGGVLNKYAGEPVPAAEVGLCMAGLKLVRESYKPKRDSRVDLIGYALCVDRIREQEDTVSRGHL